MFSIGISFCAAAQTTSDTMVLVTLPDTIIVSSFTDYDEYEFAFLNGQNYDPDTLLLYRDTLLISSIALPKTSVTTVSEQVSTPLHNGSGYEINNGFGISSEMGYYLIQNTDGTIQLNDWTQSLSGEIISAESFGNQMPVEFVVVTDGQTSFLDSSLDMTVGEAEVYVNGLRLLSTEFSIDSTNTGIILNNGLSIGENVVIDID